MEIVGLEDIPKQQGYESEDEDIPVDPELLPKNSLMSLLSGNQTKNKKQKSPTKSKIREKDNDNKYIQMINDNENINKLESKFYRLGKTTSSKDILKTRKKSDPVQLPSTPPKLNHIDPAHLSDNESDVADTTLDIEAKIYGNKKSTSVKDLFSNFKPKHVVTLKIPPDMLRKCSSDILEDEHEDTEIIESKIFANAKSVNVQDMFKQMKPQPNKFVRLKMSPDILLRYSSEAEDEIEEMNTSDIERKIFESKPKSSVLSILGLKQPVVKSTTKKSKLTTATKAKETFFVTLRVNPTELTKIKQYDNPLITRGVKTSGGGGGGGKSSKSFFASMMQASKAATKLEHIQQEKEIKPPEDLKKWQFHIYDKMDNDIPRQLNLKRRKRKFDVDVGGQFSLCPDMLSCKNSKQYKYETKPLSDLQEYAMFRLPKLQKAPALQFAFNKIGQNSGTELWVDFFKPQQVNDLLMHKENKTQIYNWISNSFAKLENQAPLKDMKQKIKQRRLQQLQDPFVVYDNEGEETDEEVFSPFLIIQGSCGSGKSSAVHTVMNQLQGYVHEINTGQNRGRKDIYNNLKELCTTQSVKDTSEFHNGLVLLEDINILFEQDKTFWQVVQEIVNISKRPIILTCEELWNIPKSLIEFAQHDNSMVFMDDYTVLKKLVVDYLWICCLVHHCDVEFQILDDIVDENWNGHNFDIRGSLMQCQILCESSKTDSITVIKRPPSVERPEVTNLADLMDQLEMSSSADVLQSLSKSQFKFTRQENELDDIYWIDEFNQTTLPYELNIGDVLQSQFKQLDKSIPEVKFLMNDLRHETKTFLGSRAKFFLNISLKRTRTGGGSFSMLDTVGVPDTSCLNHVSNTSFILDILPMARHWTRFQKSIDQFENDSLEQGKPSIKQFLKYRDFNYESTLEATINFN